MNIDKHNWKKFRKSNLLPDKDGFKPTDNASQKIFEKNAKVLNDFKAMFDSLNDIKLSRERNVRYTFGDQLSDKIKDPDSKKYISERDYMIKQGMVPLEMNVIRKTVKALLGVYRQNKLEPIAIARDRDEQKLGEMMSIAMQYAYQNNNIYETNVRGYEEFLLSALVCFRTGYDWYSDRKTSDVVIDLCDINRMAWDSDTSGQYFENISTIGYLHDMTLGKVLSTFAKSRAQKEQIIQIYKDVVGRNVTSVQQFEVNDTRKTSIDFYTPLSPDKCRVIEIWSKEETDAYACHDTATGEYYTVDIDEEDLLIAENESRIAKMIELGGNPDDAALIDYEYKVDEEWVVRYLSPNGYVLHQSVTPYAHGSHPFTIGAYPLVNGEVHSLVADTLNVQRMINRLIMRIEFTRMNAAKGFALINKRLLNNSGVSVDEFTEQWSSPKGVVAMDWEAGDEPIKQYNDTSNNNADVQMLAQYFSLNEGISGVHGALQGEKAASNTPASLYQQQTTNSNNNIADGQEWYNGLVRLRDAKMMAVIQQYYQGKRFINIAGKDYSEESKWYDSDKIRNTMFDLALLESTSNGVTRAQNEALLLELLKMQAIDPVTFLESSNTPFADKVLERIKSKQEEQEEQQRQLQEQAAAQQLAQQQPVPQQLPMQ